MGRMRVGYFGPEGTYTHEAMLAALAGAEVDEVPLPTIVDTVIAVRDQVVERAIVPIENSIEGSVDATLDALVSETEDVAIVGEVLLGIRHCLIARQPLEPAEIEVVVSHPQANAQCARFIRAELPRARVIAGASTADAVRTVAAHDGPWAALGNRTAAQRYGCRVLRAGVEDEDGNETRFVWLAREAERGAGGVGGVGSAAAGGVAGVGSAAAGGAGGPYKTAIVFWPRVSDAPGWLVACLAELAQRGVNLTRIESRPRRRQGMGRYMFFVDLEGAVTDPHIADGLAGVRRHVETLRVLGSFPAAPGATP